MKISLSFLLSLLALAPLAQSTYAADCYHTDNGLEANVCEALVASKNKLADCLHATSTSQARSICQGIEAAADTTKDCLHGTDVRDARSVCDGLRASAGSRLYSLSH
mgnify:CR=1 FL=1